MRIKSSLLIVACLMVSDLRAAEWICAAGAPCAERVASADELSRYGLLELRVSTHKLPRRGDVHVIIANDWKLTLSVREQSDTIPIRLPHGTYDVFIEGARAMRMSKSIAIANTPARISVELEPLPRLSGTVLARSGRRPVAGALIHTDASGNDVEKSAITDAAGRFVIDLELQQIVRNRATGKPVATLPVPPALQKASLRFENVEPGRYVVLAKGDEALERYGTVIEVVQENDVPVAFSIVPFFLRLLTKLDGETLPKAEIHLTHFQGYWEGSLETDGEGKADAHLWQAGTLRPAVRAAGFTAPYMGHRMLLDGEDDEWVLDVDALEIVGTVVDSKTGAPIANAAVSLDVESDDGFRWPPTRKPTHWAAFVYRLCITANTR